MKILIHKIMLNLVAKEALCKCDMLNSATMHAAVWSRGLQRICWYFHGDRPIQYQYSLHQAI